MFTRVIFPCVVWKATAHIWTKVLNMSHQVQKGFCGIFVGIPQNQKVYLVYVPSSSKIISSYDLVFHESLSSALAYTPQPYPEALAMRPYMTYKLCDTSSREQTGNIITFAQFEKENILTKTRNDVEIGDDDSIIPTPMSEEDMDAMNSGDESDHDIISTEMLEDICDVGHSHPKFNQIEARSKIRDRIRQIQS